LKKRRDLSIVPSSVDLHQWIRTSFAISSACCGELASLHLGIQSLQL
jgi:hypothetical protein